MLNKTLIAFICNTASVEGLQRYSKSKRLRDMTHIVMFPVCFTTAQHNNELMKYPTVSYIFVVYYSNRT
jgi:hypothetical protein